MKNKIIEMLPTHSVKEIMEETGLSQSQVYKIRRSQLSKLTGQNARKEAQLVGKVENVRCGNAHYKSQLEDEEFDKLYAQYLEGHSIRSLWHEGLNISYQALAQRIRRREKIRGNKFIAPDVENMVEVVAEEISSETGVVWAPIEHPDLVDQYFITACGRVRSWKKELKVSKGKVGIRGKVYGVGRLVANTFLPNPDGHKKIKFIDGNPCNCHVNNVTWQHRQLDKGFRYSTGEISEIRARMIRDDWSTGKYSLGDLRYRHKRKEKELMDVLNDRLHPVGFSMFKSLPTELVEFVCENYVYGDMRLKEICETYSLPEDVVRLVQAETPPRVNVTLVV